MERYAPTLPVKVSRSHSGTDGSIDNHAWQPWTRLGCHAEAGASWRLKHSSISDMEYGGRVWAIGDLEPSGGGIGRQWGTTWRAAARLDLRHAEVGSVET